MNRNVYLTKKKLRELIFVCLYNWKYNSVGSLGAEGGDAAVSNVQVTHCTFNQTKNGARIKTWPVLIFYFLLSQYAHI